MPKSNVPDIEFDYEIGEDMRESLVNNLRLKAKTSRLQKNDVLNFTQKYGVNTKPARIIISLENSEPQAVLIKNRNENLNSEVLKLRARYANLLTKEVSD